MMFGVVSTDAKTPFEGETGPVPKIVNRLNYGVLFVYEGQSIPIIDKWKYIFEIKLPAELFKTEKEFLESLNFGFDKSTTAQTLCSSKASEGSYYSDQSGINSCKKV